MTTMMASPRFRLLGIFLLLATASSFTMRGGSRLSDDVRVFHFEREPIPLVAIRQLETGDDVKDRFNELFQDVLLPDADVGSGELDLEIRNLICEDVNAGNITTGYEVLQEEVGQTVAFDINVEPFAMTCFADYSYRFGSLLLQGSGTFEAETMDNRATARLDLNSPDIQQEPPSKIDVEFCEASVSVVSISFEGGVVASMLNLFEDVIGNVLEDTTEGGTLFRCA
jgi:hypothetical protein